MPPTPSPDPSPLRIGSCQHRISTSHRCPLVSISDQCPIDGTHVIDFLMQSSDPVTCVTNRTASLPPTVIDKAGLFRTHASPKPSTADLEDPSHGQSSCPPPMIAATAPSCTKTIKDLGTTAATTTNASITTAIVVLPLGCSPMTMETFLCHISTRHHLPPDLHPAAVTSH